jgi:hypothetical protein
MHSARVHSWIVAAIERENFRQLCQETVAPQPRRGQVWTVTGTAPHRVLTQSGADTIGTMVTARNLTAAVHQEEDWYVAQCLEVDGPAKAARSQKL